MTFHNFCRFVSWRLFFSAKGSRVAISLHRHPFPIDYSHASRWSRRGQGGRIKSDCILRKFSAIEESGRRIIKISVNGRNEVIHVSLVNRRFACMNRINQNNFGMARRWFKVVLGPSVKPVARFSLPKAETLDEIARPNASSALCTKPILFMSQSNPGREIPSYPTFLHCAVAFQNIMYRWHYILDSDVKYTTLEMTFVAHKPLYLSWSFFRLNTKR